MYVELCRRGLIDGVGAGVYKGGLGLRDSTFRFDSRFVKDGLGDSRLSGDWVDAGLAWVFLVRVCGVGEGQVWGGTRRLSAGEAEGWLWNWVESDQMLVG